MGRVPLIGEGRIVQFMPFLRKGIISSVLPFPGPQPHGFTLDIMSQGGSSGSPVFLADSGRVVGLLYGGFENANMTYAVPAAMIYEGMQTWLAQCKWDFTSSPHYDEYVAKAPGNQLQFEQVSADEVSQLLGR